MPKNERTRIDYMPGGAAIEALQRAESTFPNLRTQALIDKLVITGFCALQWKPPTLYGNDRDKWKLPSEPGKAA